MPSDSSRSRSAASHLPPGPARPPLILAPLTSHTPVRYETTKSADAVAALKASLKPIATVKRDGGPHHSTWRACPWPPRH